MRRMIILSCLIFLCLQSFNVTLGNERGSIIGNARQARHGPADELLGFKPIYDMPILLIPLEVIEDQELITVTNHKNSWQLFELYNGSPKALHIQPNQQGYFSSKLPEGSYLICTAFTFPWNKRPNSYVHRQVDIEKNRLTILTITYVTMMSRLQIHVY